MKSVLLVAAMSFVGSYALTAPAQPTILGEWNLVGRSCTSNTPTKDSIKIGKDKIGVIFNADKSYELKMIVAGCETKAKGTYAVDGMKINFTAVTSQSCKDTSPQPTPETYSMYAAYLSNTEVVLVATGYKAAANCPASDALVFHYKKVL